MTDTSQDNATENLLRSFTTRAASRRGFLKGAAAAGAAAAGMGILKSTAHAQSAPNPTFNTPGSPDTAATIFSIAATAERLAVTFYTNGVNNAAALGLSGAALDAIKAALIEEQIHELFFEAAGGQALTSTFSFPSGATTFTDLATFIATQQQLEGAFDSAFIAAVREFAEGGRPDLAAIACQIAMVESEHLALGRYIGGLDPADNVAFRPQLVPTVGSAPAVLQGAGYLSPTTGNTYTYQQADFTSASLAPIYAKIEYKEPFAAGVAGAPTTETFVPGPAVFVFP